MFQSVINSDRTLGKRRSVLNTSPVEKPDVFEMNSSPAVSHSIHIVTKGSNLAALIAGYLPRQLK